MAATPEATAPTEATSTATQNRKAGADAPAFVFALNSLP